VEFVKCLDFGIYASCGKANQASLAKDVYPEPFFVFDTVSEVKGAGLYEGSISKTMVSIFSLVIGSPVVSLRWP
jgi:hypothetical protein